MNKRIYGVLVFLVLLFVTLGAVSAADVSDDDTSAVSSVSSPTIEDVVEDVTPTTTKDTTRTTVSDNSVVTVGDNEVIDGNGTTYTNTSFKVTGNNAVLKNFQLNDENIEKVIEVNGVNNLSIQNIQIASTYEKGATVAIDLKNTTNSIIKDCTIIVNASRGTGIATHTSNNNHYDNNNIVINCNQDTINNFYEMITPQNVGIIIINSSNNQINNNYILINETNTTNTTYAIILDENSTDNMGSNNDLTVRNLTDITKEGINAILDEGFNSVTTISKQTLLKKSLKDVKESNEIIINDENLNDYAKINPDNLSFEFMSVTEDTDLIINLTDKYSKYDLNFVWMIFDSYKLNIQVLSEHTGITLMSFMNPVTVHDSILPKTMIASNNMGYFKDSVFLDVDNTGSFVGGHFDNVTFIADNENIEVLSYKQSGSPDMCNKQYSDFFDSNNVLLDSVNSGTTIIIRHPGINKYSEPIIINKPVNLTGVFDATWSGDITFISGSEGSNLTDMTLNGTVYINTTNIGLYNNTINKGVVIKDSADSNIEDNTFNTEAEAITLTNTIKTTITNNNINAGSEYAVTLDNDSIENVVRGNVIYASGREGNDAVSADKGVNTVEHNSPGVVDLYVSDNAGSDENSGSSSAPLKTIQAAIDQANTVDTFNIHITEGVYKGVGNTNLTVPGDYKINFIGDGVGKTVLDGEAKFTLPGGGSVWGGSAIWNTWLNTSGNWIMNITSGSGLFNIQNMTIQNSWASSGSSIVATSPTIDNRANLNVSNVYFYSNHAGNGAGIRNNYGGTLYVDNCTFENNTKSSTTGNYGAAVYNNGTAVMTNTYIVRNYARWGSVTNDKNMTLVNCTFEGNYAYDAASGYKNGPSFSADTGISNMFMMYAVYNLSSTIINCTFNDNQQCDISNGRGDLVVDGCVFNHSTGVYLFPNNNRLNTYMPTQNITNNVFIDMQPSTVFATMLSSTTPSVAVRSLSNYNASIVNNTIDVQDTIYGYGLYLTGNAYVYNNTLNNYIYSAGQNNTITGNVINTTKENTVTLTSAALNNIITNNTLIGGYTNGDLSVGNVLASTIVENNIPETEVYTINDDNYTAFFDESGVLRNDVVTDGSKITFVNNLTNKKFIFDNIKVLVDVNTTLYNTTIITSNGARVLFNNLKIDNSKDEEEFVILLDSEGNIIRNANIQINSKTPVQVIKIEEDENIITGSTINASMPASDVKYNSDYSIGNVPSAGIFIRSSNNKVNSTRLYIYADAVAEGSYYPTVDGIDIQSKRVGEFVTGNEIRSSRINVTGGRYVYGLNIARAENTITPLSYYDVTSNYYADAIQIGDSNNNNISGYVYAKADDTAYAFYSTAMATGITNNTNISSLYIQNMQAPTATGILLEGASNIIIASGTHNIYGEVVTGIEIKKDWMNNIPENINITKLTINLDGTNVTSSMITTSTAKNINITANSIKSTSGTGITLANTTGSSVTSNYINVANMIGGDSAVNSQLEATIFNNTPKIAVLTDETYHDFFDENGVCYVDYDIITVAGDLHDKVLIFNNHTKVINITNAADYTLYNSTIIIAGNGTYGDRYGFTVENLNFNNTDKPVFIDQFNGTGQKNVKFVNDNIYVTGSDIVAFDAYNNESYIYLDISNTNITMDGDNVVAVAYAGYNRGQPGYVTKNNIYLTATNKATVFEAANAAIQFNNNNVTIVSKEAVVANLQNSSISYYSFDENIINITASDAIVLNMTKGDTYTAYISDNEIYVKTENPATLINISGPRTVYVQGNEIVLDTANGETPIISVENPSSYVRNNYIVSRDLQGNDAAVANTVSGNTPEAGQRDVFITINEDVEFTATMESTITINVTDDFDEPVEGNITVTINDEVVNVNEDNTVVYTPKDNQELTVKITYTDDAQGKYKTTTETYKFSVNKAEATIDVSVLGESVVNNTVRLSINLKNANGNKITKQNITITTPEGSETVQVRTATVIYKYTPTTSGEQTITVALDENNIYETVSQNITLNVTETSKIDDLNDKVDELTRIKNTTIALENIETAKYNDEITIRGTLVNENNNKLSDQEITININGEEVKVTTVNGVFTYTYTAKTLGEQNITATFAGNDKYAQSEATTNFYVQKKPVLYFYGVENTTEDSTVTVSGKLLNNGKAISGATVTLNVNGEDVTVTPNKDGYFKYSFKAIAGENIVTATYAGTEDYAAANASTSVYAMMKTTLYAYKIENANTQDSIKVSGKLLNKGKAVVGETVTILVNGQTYTATTNKDGYFQVNIRVATAGENNLTVTYAGSDAYLAAQYNSTFTTKAKTTLFAYTLSEATVGSPAKISGKLQSNKQAVANKEVTVKVGTTTYTATTNKDGYYSVSYTPSAAGTENVSISYAGDDEYLTSSYNTTLTVKE